MTPDGELVSSPTSEDRCPDCGAATGRPHLDSCDVARCLTTGYQRLMCDFFDDEDGDEEGGGHCGDDVWLGRWPGEAECEEFGWWVQDRCSEGLGFVPCAPAAPGARHDLNRLYRDATWDPFARRWRRSDIDGAGWSQT